MAFALLVLAASGSYVIVYLVRWEWHRALIAGLFFVATEIALVGMALLRRLRALERHLAPPPTAHNEVVLGLLRDSAPPPEPRFAWLSTDPGRLGVFLPVLLGAGALASAIAWAVEWTARATARPTLERRLAVRLGALSLPGQGLLDPEDPGPVIGRRLRPGRLPAWAAGVAAVAVILAVGVDDLADATQTRPDPSRPGWATTVEVQLHGAGDPEMAGNNLWAACRHLLGHRVHEARIDHLGAGRFRAALGSHLGPHAADRLHGCLEDAAVDHVQGRVVRISAVRRAGVSRGGGERPAAG
jgi:hypothetical protein